MITRKNWMITVLLLAFCIPASAQWKPFVEQIGAMPSDLFNPWRDMELKTQWFAKARPVLDRYASLVLLELQCRGFVLERVTFGPDKYSASAWGWGFGGVVLRGGLTVPFMMTERSPLEFDPAQMAAKIEAQWASLRESIIQRPWEPITLDGVRVTDWRTLFLWQEQPPACRVYYTPGQTCTIDLSSGNVAVEP